MANRLTVLGSCGAWPEPGRACSGFVVEFQGFRVVLDLGYGTLPRLLTLLGSPVADGLGAVVITHRHPDHMVDLHGLFRARWYGRPHAAPIPLLAAEGVLARVAELEEAGEDDVRQVFDERPLPASSYEIGPFQVESRLLPHWVPNCGVRLSAPGLTVAYTGDTGPDDALIELGRDADLFVVDATSRGQRDQHAAAPPGPLLLLTAHEAGEFAAAAGARRLLLTHFWPGNDRERSRAEALRVFDGEVLIADEGVEVLLP
jgi:ribonuclease BN (tRNA processing enzyme)